jgi:YHS domain-containing protein
MMKGEKIMSEYVWCHGTNCHTNHTLDRVRGSKGNKVLRTRKVQFNPEYINMYSYFCSNQCYNDFANQTLNKLLRLHQEPSLLKHRLKTQKELNMKMIMDILIMKQI